MYSDRRLTEPHLRGRLYEWSKRAADCSLSIFLLVLLSPLLAVIALLIRTTSPGGAIFRQRRVGHGGRVFLIWKFRTMALGAEEAGPAITSANDSRVTAVGRLLRMSKLDELPQLWNVVRGDMSLVGPRPQVPAFVDAFDPDLRRMILSVRPGITGPAQIRFINEERLLESAIDRERYYVDHLLPLKSRMDAQYVQQRSLTGDMGLLAATIVNLIPRPRRNGFAPGELAVVRETHADQEAAA